VVLSSFGVMFFDDPAAAFGNLRKALRRGGRLAFACWRTLAENVGESIHKGDRVIVYGKVASRQWEGRDGQTGNAAGCWAGLPAWGEARDKRRCRGRR